MLPASFSASGQHANHASIAYGPCLPARRRLPVRGLIFERWIPVVKIGRLVRIDDRVLEEFIDGGRVATAQVRCQGHWGTPIAASERRCVMQLQKIEEDKEVRW